jgi:hypothetical protein
LFNFLGNTLLERILPALKIPIDPILRVMTSNVIVIVIVIVIEIVILTYLLHGAESFFGS